MKGQFLAPAIYTYVKWKQQEKKKKHIKHRRDVTWVLPCREEINWRDQFFVVGNKISGEGKTGRHVFSSRRRGTRTESYWKHLVKALQNKCVQNKNREPYTAPQNTNHHLKMFLVLRLAGISFGLCGLYQRNVRTYVCDKN